MGIVRNMLRDTAIVCLAIIGATATGPAQADPLLDEMVEFTGTIFSSTPRCLPPSLGQSATARSRCVASASAQVLAVRRRMATR